MKTLKLLVFCLASALFCNFLNAQSFIGYTTDNYSGIHSVTVNPANVVNDHFKLDFNLISSSAFGGSDYFGINLSDIIKSDGGLDFDEDTERFPTNNNNFFFNADVLGPSFMFKLSPKSSIGLTTRVRGFLNLHSINGELYENITDNFNSEEDFDFESNNLVGNIHAWAEIGVAYGRILVDNDATKLKAGVTLKYLQGAGSVFVNSPEFNGQYRYNGGNGNQTLTTTGSLIYGSSNDFDSDDIDFKDLTAGFATDIGFVFELKNKNVNEALDSLNVNASQYKLKLAASITDLGSINYKETTITTYDLNATADASTFDDDTQEFLDNNYTSTETIAAQKTKLPTALHLLADYSFTKKIFLSVQGDFSLNKETEMNANSIINQVTVMPRLETKFLGLYSPISFRQYDSVAWGAGLRVGPLTIGSGSVLSNLLSSSSKTTDVFVATKISIKRKK